MQQINVRVLYEEMKDCFQYKTINMIDHGQMVHDSYNQIIQCCENKDTELKLPSCTFDLYKKHKQLLIEKENSIRLYQLFHDCGKKRSKIVDDNGKIHYPNHAQISYEFFSKNCDDIYAADLILHDMHLHILKGEELDKFIQEYDKIIPIWFTSLAEIHANSEMFGGIESDSFKIKFKKLDKIGKKLINLS